jgi:hypothetical protein
MEICDELDSAEFVKRRREGKVSIFAPLQTSQQYQLHMYQIKNMCQLNNI